MTSRVLVVGPAWVGDMVMAQSLFKVLVQRDDVSVDVLAPPWSLPLLARMPEVNRAIEAPFAHKQLCLGARHRLGRKLRAKHYDQSIVLPNSWKSALIPLWAKIPKRTGFRGEQRWGLLNDIRRLHDHTLPMTVQRFVALGLEANAAPLSIGRLPLPSLHCDSVSVKNTVETLEVRVDRPALALCAGAEYGPAKRWPVEYFARVANAKLSDNWHVWLLGSEQDSHVTESINRLCNGQCYDLAGRTTLEQVIDLLSLPNLVISNDSGLMHVAAALDRPLIALYGSSDPTHTPPLNDKCKIVYLDLDCSPCFRRECPLKHHNCMQNISPGQIVDASKQMLDDIG